VTISGKNISHQRGSEPSKFIGFRLALRGLIDGPKAYKFIAFRLALRGPIDGPKPYKFMGLEDIDGPKGPSMRRVFAQLDLLRFSPAAVTISGKSYLAPIPLLLYVTQ
jgi:hypothetical protein